MKKKANENYPLMMTEEFLANSQLSVVRYYGRIELNGRVYIICDKTGRDIFQLSAIAAKQGKQKAIDPGEPADLVLMTLLPAYRKFGRERFISLIKEGKSEKEIIALAKSVTNTGPNKEKVKSLFNDQ